MPPLSPRARAAVTALLAVIYALHAVTHALDDDPLHLLWACNVSLLLIAAGFALNQPRLNAIGFTWIVYGTPIWLVDVAAGNPQLWTSWITHFGGIAIAAWGMKTLGVPRGTWWLAPAAFLPLLALTRLVSPPALNINLAFRVYDGFEDLVPSHAAYIAILLAGCALTGLALETAARWLVRKTTPAAEA